MKTFKKMPSSNKINKHYIDKEDVPIPEKMEINPESMDDLLTNH